jgi:hypothetical protein
MELLKTHEDLTSTIDNIASIKEFHVKEKYNMSRDFDFTLIEDTSGKCTHHLICDMFQLFPSSDDGMPSAAVTTSFVRVNGVILYKKGLVPGLSANKRSMIHCNVCTECWLALSKEKVPKFSIANKVWLGDVPIELQGLTLPEQRLISIYRHNSCIVKLHSSFHTTATAQSAIKGNCISFPQDVVNIASSLPLELNDLCDSLKIIFIGCHAPERKQLKHILTVRKKKVSDALRWLRQNNPLYHTVVIDQERIDQLPVDDVPDSLWTTIQISTDVQASEGERASYTSDPLHNIGEENNSSVIPLIPR